MKLYLMLILGMILIPSCSSYEDAEKQFRSEFHLKDTISTEYAGSLLGLSRRDIIERYKNQ